MKQSLKIWLASLALRAYHSLMDSQIIPAQNGKFVTKIRTPSGVVGVVASDVSEKGVEGLLNRLLARQLELENKGKSNVRKTATRAGRGSKVSVSV